MLKVIRKSTYTTYAEEGQSNPIRWAILSYDGKNFTQESAWIKCKDFFNDYVYSYRTGKFFSIYGFSPSDYKMPKVGEPMYMELKGTTPSFVHNLNLVNDWLVSDQKAPAIPLQTTADKSFIIALDEFYLRNTYNMSLISLLIRVINTDQAFKSFDEIKAFRPTGSGSHGGDAGKWGAVVDKKVFFKLPEKMSKFIWYCGPNDHSESGKVYGYGLSSMIHNCGVLTWNNFL